LKAVTKFYFIIFVISAINVFVAYENGYAQSVFTRELIIPSPETDTSYFLGNWVLEESISVSAGKAAIDREFWSFNPLNGRWKLERSIAGFESDSLFIQYQIYPYAIRRTFGNRSVASIPDNFYTAENDSIARELIRTSRNSFYDSDLNQRGSLTRGIIVGSNQDFALESGLQFELSGQLTDDIAINASLTDASIPFQPDGTTQSIREFDRVLIQLNGNNFDLDMGDVDLSLNASRYAKLNRRLQGVNGEFRTEAGNYRSALSVVKGTFQSKYFQGQDGVQGPYRLTGENGEQFVIVLAGTERVFVNGVEVKRGEENEYIIDYGLGEVYFTNNLLIKDETRIVIEYEYLEQNFNRTLIAAEVQEQLFNDRFSIGATVIRQADGNDLLSQQTLTQANIDDLKLAGDDPDGVVVSGAGLATDEDRYNVKYALIDTTWNGQDYQIYKNLPGSEDAIYVVSFSKVNSGKGSYQRVSGSVNGLVYNWVGPGNGDYEPFRKLPAPEKLQMVALNSRVRISEHISWFGEWSVSGYDKNRFSGLDDGDNNDHAYTSGLSVDSIHTGAGVFRLDVRRSYRGKNFETFERIRPVEFERQWDVQLGGGQEEVINELNVNYKTGENTETEISAGTIQLSDYSGNRQALQLSSAEVGLPVLNYTLENIDSENSLTQQKGEWFRQRGSISKEVHAFAPYIMLEQEQRIRRSTISDSLLATSLEFTEIGPGLRYKKGALELNTGISARMEKSVLDNALQDEFSALEKKFGFNYRASSGFRTVNNIVLRSKSYSEAFAENRTGDRDALLVTSRTNYGAADKMLEGQFNYEVNTQRQALTQETYFEVGPELGQYVWIDENGDGTEQLDEFYPELSPNEGTYVKQFIPSDDLLSVINLSTRWRNQVKPFINKEHRFSELTLFSSIDIRENSTTDVFSDVYLLKMNTFRNDSTTISGRINQSYEADLFPTDFNMDTRLGYSDNRSLNQRSNESVQNYSKEWYASISYRVTPKLRFFGDLNRGRNISLSDQLSNRNFEIRSMTVSPGVEWLINRSWQTSLSSSFSIKTDRFPVVPAEAAMVKIVQTNRAFLFKKIQADSRIEFRNTKLEGVPGTLSRFELTEGTGSGNHLIWSVSANYRVSDLVRFRFEYDGRTVNDRPDIHTLKLTVSAVF
tara:strand:- start:8942 stop:12397 length:3456 start_codon:yes stop_codon:yes gene_type:complete